MFGFKKSVQAFDAQFAAPAALLDAAEWALAGGGHAVVDADRPGFEQFRQPEHAAQVAREGVGAQAVAVNRWRARWLRPRCRMGNTGATGAKVSSGMHTASAGTSASTVGSRKKPLRLIRFPPQSSRAPRLTASCTCAQWRCSKPSSLISGPIEHAVFEAVADFQRRVWATNFSRNRS